ncbi:MAG TPA: carboxylesterase family protein [Streptosporangiaceae bacterium]|jgi:para-nitrobenzyl esterase
MTDVIALTAQGRLRGQRDGQALRFLGVPYAESPVTAGRFAVPVPPARWDGVRDALAYGATSPQPDRGITLIPEPVIAGDNELNLNVFTPDLAAGLPVLVWIHGGGFTGGCNASPWYRGGPFARDGVVLVSINYRLGAEGFLELPGAPANRAVRDWIRALEWVQENIAAFGGDPGRVTIGGQSAGGAACATLLAAPAARGLFRAAACMSGAQALMQTPEGVRAVAAQLAGHLGPLTREALEELPAEVILAAQEAVTASLGAAAGRRDAEAIATLLGGGISLPWAPFADGEVVTEEPLAAAASPRHREVSLLAGATAQEFNMVWLAADWITPAIAADGLAQAGVPAPAVAAYLDRAGSPPGKAVGQAVTDRVFRVPAQQLAAAKAAAGGSAFTYDFRWTAPGGPLPGLAFHCIDVPFFFDALAEPGVTEAFGPAPPQDLATCAHGALVRFVTGGDPGWEPFSDHRSPVMIFAEPSEVRENPLELERTAWTR